MRAAAFHTFGGPEVLEVIEVATPVAAPGEVRVRVEAAGVQAYDSAVRSGWTPPGQTVRFPQIVGNDFAGVVDQTGAGVTDFRTGDEVLGWAVLASCAEYVVVPAGQIVAKPAGMPWPQAGTLSASAQTAHTALEELKVSAGDTLLIHGASGGVGTVAVQLALAAGAQVIGTASPENHDYLRSLGATPTSYGDGLTDRVRALAPGGVDVALDAAGGAALDASLKLVTDRDRIGTLVDLARADKLGVRPLRSQRSAQRLQAITDLYRTGRLILTVSETFPLDRIADAHRRIDTGHARGKTAVLLRG
ncbi:NADP-dependent oxidoreductase [Micromonospora sp. STR1_7]|uniref:NADP-dependent oxidoreductase n=1 Tax=Micromonospora parastrephiae TaxID=2806101 RepID=A0ABS1XN05_9ACTN|nr:NADP-dependent oxidoreductase [Micromonospora parastrephiae]MBM0230645.1 NADP-dependent oxidoreductase [Micromonospora parastrephiae]